MKNLIFLLLIALLFVHGESNAQNNYSFSDIPKSLLENAHSVVRFDKDRITVEAVDRIIYERNHAVTILDKRAEDLGVVYVGYDEKLSKVKDFKGAIYDASGKLIRKIKKADMVDRSASGGSFATSSRVIIVDMKSNRYPYTVEYSYSLIRSRIISGWTPQGNENQSVQYASLKLFVPKGLKVDYKPHNYDVEPQTIISSSGIGGLFWESYDLPSIETEIRGPSFGEMNPRISLMQEDIKMGKWQGKMDSWDSFGKFYYDLNAGRDELPKELEAKVVEMTQGVEDPMKKINILYKYMQENTRYVSIQLGIGGWQTFDAEYVYTNGYGDCKALSNYMKSMLKTVGITGHVVLIGAGRGRPPVNTSYVNDPFNHAILCVPFESDTVWLECTSSTSPTGYMGDFTEDRFSLICSPEGGKLVKVPDSTPENNFQHRKAEIKLEPNGNATVSVSTEFGGNQDWRIRTIAKEWSPKDQEDYLKKIWIETSGSFELKDYSFIEGNSIGNPTYRLQYNLDAINWSGVSGTRLFLKPNVLQAWTNVPPKMEERTQEVVVAQSFLDVDTVVYHLPTGYSLESMPEVPISVETIFGTYTAEINMEDPQTMIYIRTLRMEKIRLPASYYEQYREFMQEVVKGDKIQVVLSNKS